MKGSNVLRLCAAEVMVALQEYLDKRWPENTPVVDAIKAEDTGESPTLAVSLKEARDG